MREEPAGGSRRRPRVVVVGVGNALRGDDAAGLAVVALVRAEAPAGVAVLERGGDPAALIEAWAGADLAIVADAVASGGTAGEVRRLDATSEPLPARTFGGSTHAIGLAEAVELARALGRLPGRLVVYGIEGGRWAPGEQPSGRVRRAVASVAASILAEARPAAAVRPPRPRSRARRAAPSRSPW